MAELPLAKVFTVTRDEYDLIEDFVAHHARLFGAANIVLLDHGSADPRVLAAYERFRAAGVEIQPVESYAGGGQGAAFTKAMLAHQRTAQYLIGLDSDEFIYSAAALAAGEDPVAPEAVAEVLRNLAPDATIFETAEYPCSKVDPESPAYRDGRVARPAVDITTFVKTNRFRPQKVFFRAKAFISAENGNHGGRVSHGYRVVAPIGYLHFHDTGSLRSFERAMKVMIGYNYYNFPPGSLEVGSAAFLEALRGWVDASAKFWSDVGKHRVVEFRRRVLHLYLYELFADVLHRYPSVWEIQYHEDRFWKSEAKDIEEDFNRCIEAKTLAPQRPELTAEQRAAHRIRLALYDEPLVGAELAYTFLTRSLAPPARRPVALVFSGHQRSLIDNADKWKRFFDRLREEGLEPDIFFHTWTTNASPRINEGKRDEGKYIEGPNKTIGAAIALLEPKAFKVEASFPHRLRVPARVFLLVNQAAKVNIASQLYSIREAFRLVEEHETKQGFKYDAVARFRFDIEPPAADEGEFARACQEDHQEVIFAPSILCHQHPGGGGGCRACHAAYAAWRAGGPLTPGCASHTNDICDIFAVGGRRAMGRYMTAYDRQDEYYTVGAFAKSYSAAEKLNMALCPCSVLGGPDGDIRAKYYRCIDIEHPDFTAYYPERLQRLNLAGLRVVHYSCPTPRC